jgi:cytoskeleton protein RodZ
MTDNSQGQEEKTSELTHDSAVVMSPGALLRDRRLALHLNEWDIAREMRLQTQYILDLENDNFDAFSSLAFVRGYLRGYAKIVGIDEADVIQLFNQLSVQEKPSMNVPKYITHSSSRSDTYWRWMGVFVIGFIGISVVLWWQNHGETTNSLSTSVTATLEKVNTLERNLTAEQDAEKAKVEAAAAVEAANPIQQLGTSGALLTHSATQPMNGNNQNNTAVTTAENGNINASSANNPMMMNNTTNTMMPNTSMSNAAESNPMTEMQPNNANSNAATTPASTPAAPSHHKKSSQMHEPVIDGQAPRFGG